MRSARWQHKESGDSMRFLLAGGGTGGHIYPAMAIAGALLVRRPGAEVLFCGTSAGLETELVPAAGYRLHLISARGFRRSLGFDTVRSALAAVKGLWEAYRLLGEYKPAAVIGTGGYVCGPVLLAAWLRGVPAYLQEQNAMPGVTNRLLARFVRAAYLGYEEGRPYFAATRAVVWTGNPLRSLGGDDQRAALVKLGLDPTKKTVLVTGGSRGARSINRAVAAAFSRLVADEGVQYLHVTGRDEFEATNALLIEQGLAACPRFHVQPYLHDMPVALKAADVVLCRAGAIALAEVAALGLPAILVPYPYATGNHQEANARAFEKRGAAIMVLDKELNGDKLAAELLPLVHDEKRLALMQQAAATLAKPGAADEIAAHLLADLAATGV